MTPREVGSLASNAALAALRQLDLTRPLAGLVDVVDLAQAIGNNTAQAISFAEVDPPPLTDVLARLIAAFDAATAVRCDLVFFEKEEPEAPTALALWASSRNLRAERRECGAGVRVLSVETSRHRRIDVHLIVAELRRAS